MEWLWPAIVSADGPSRIYWWPGSTLNINVLSTCLPKASHKVYLNFFVPEAGQPWNANSLKILCNGWSREGCWQTEKGISWVFCGKCQTAWCNFSTSISIWKKNFTHVSRVKWQSFLTASRLQMQSVKNGIEFFPFFSFATWESKK